MLIKGFLEPRYMIQAYFLLLTIRNLCHGLIIGLLFDHPIVQVSLLIALNVLTIIYLGSKKPFINIFMVFQQLAFELVLLLSNICFLIMAILDATKPSKATGKQMRYTLGLIVLNAIFTTKFIPLITLVPKIYFILKKLYDDRKAKKNAAKNPPPTDVEAAALNEAKTAAVEAETAALVSPQNPDQQQQGVVEKEVTSAHRDEKEPMLEKEKSLNGHSENRTPDHLVAHSEEAPVIRKPTLEKSFEAKNQEEQTHKTESYQDYEFSEECPEDNSIHVMQMGIPSQMWRDTNKK